MMCERPGQKPSEDGLKSDTASMPIYKGADDEELLD